MKRLFLICTLIFGTSYGADQAPTSAVDSIKQMLPNLTPEGRRRAVAILKMAEDPEFERVWQQVQTHPAAHTTLQPPNTQSGLQRLEQFTQLMQQLCNTAVSVNSLGVSAHELYKFLMHGQSPQGNPAAMPMHSPMHRPMMDPPMMSPRRPYGCPRPWSAMPDHPVE